MATPVKVPSAAGSYTAATQDLDLRSQINVSLLHHGHAAKIQENLLHLLHAHRSNWPTAVQSHALALLRSGEVSTFPALLRRVLDDIKQETLAASPKPAQRSEHSTSPITNGAAANGNTRRTNHSETPAAVAVPTGVIEDALKVTRDCLENTCDVEGST